MADINDQALAWAQANPSDLRAQDVMAKAWAAKNPDDPRAQAINDRFAEQDTRLGKAKQIGLGTLGALGKVTGVLRNLTTGPATAAVLKAATGKDVANLQDVGESVNPTNLKQFPSNSEMFARAGVKNPALSDAIPGYAEKGSDHPWYQPEKGGLLDPTVAGTLQTITDPAMWLGAGEVGAGARALQEASLAGKVGKVVDAANVVNPGAWVAKGIDAVPGVAGAARTVANPLSALARATGKGMYGATIRPVEHEADKFGKQDVRDALMSAGAWRAGVVPEKAQAAADTLMGARNKLFSEAADAGATINMRQALAPGYAEVARLRSLGSEMADHQANALEAELDGVVARAEGTPATPAVPPSYAERTRQTGTMGGELNDPIMKTETIMVDPGSPGTPGVEPKPYTPQAASDLKTYYTNELPASTYNQQLKTPPSARGLRETARGLKEGVEQSVENATGKGTDVEDVNKTLGALVGTKRSQQFVANKSDREFDNIVKGTGMDALVGGGVAATTGNPGAGLAAIAGKKALNLTRMGTMPAGYGLKGLGDTEFLDRLNELIQQKKQESKYGKSQGN